MSIYTYISIGMYVYMRLPKIWAHGIYRYIVGVEVLDLTHINFRKVGFQYKFIVTVKACNCCRPGQDDYTYIYILSCPEHMLRSSDHCSH